MRYLRGQPSKENAVAYCHHPNHVGYLSPAIMKKHDCLNKKCKYLHIYEENDHWVQRAKRNREKKFRKWLQNDDYERIAEYIAELIGRNYEQEGH